MLSYDLRNSSVFNAGLKVCSDGSDMIAGGSMFHTLAAATGKARSPMVLCNDRGTCNNAVDKDRRRLRKCQCRQPVVAHWQGSAVLCCYIRTVTAAPSLAVFRQHLKTFLFSRSLSVNLQSMYFFLHQRGPSNNFII